MSKKLQDKQRRRLAEQMRREQQRRAARRSNLITVTIAVVIIGVVSYFIISERSGESDAPAAPEGVAAADAGCDEVEEHDVEGSNHVDSTAEVDYETSPPTSGNHWGNGLQSDPGFYPEAPEDESLVHNLEHGQIVIWYSQDASSETIDNLQTFTESANDPGAVEAGEPPIITVPYDDVDEGMSYVLTAWGASQACARYSLAAINEFRTRYQGRGPEQATATFSG